MNPRTTGLALSICFFLMLAPLWAQDQVWLIGGGPAVEDSQAQIEENVRWVRSVIEGLPGSRALRVYFTDGDHHYPDVLEWRPVAETPDRLQPLARVLDSYLSNGEIYRNHRLDQVAGSTQADELQPVLQAALEQLQPADRFWLIFNGHGREGETPLDNTLELWNYTDWTVTDLQQLLSRGNREALTRFVFTQCYAGGFARMVYVDANADQGLNEYSRCGFMAVAEDQPAEGCSPVLEVGNYQDYSTYFFAALAGKARTGDPLAFSPDLDADTRVTPYEAHLYALRAARSTDMPRATSEDYLLRWSPWYARWWPLSNEESHYGQLAAALASDLGVEPVSPALSQRREALLQQLQNTTRQREEIRAEINNLRDPIRYALVARWPALNAVHTLGYKRFLEQDLEQAQAYIVRQPEYPLLVESQRAYWSLMNAEVELERALNHLARVEHLYHLDRLLRLFQERANTREREEYARLLGCEQTPF